MSAEADNLIQDTKRLCVRIGGKGDKVVEQRDDTVVDMWRRFNVDFRPESALFVDGVCVHVGGHTKAACEEFAIQLNQKPAAAQNNAITVVDDLLAALQ
jgi:hypothetical protein